MGVKRSLWGILLAGIVLFAGCGNSLQEDLLTSQKRFQSLDTETARRFVPQNLQKIEIILSTADNNFKAGNADLAARDIQTANILLEQTAASMQKHVEKAKAESLALLDNISRAIERMQSIVPELPAKTYADQNRRDIVRFRIWSLQERLKEVQRYAQAKNYIGIQDKAPEIKRAISDLITYIEKPRKDDFIQTARFSSNP